MDFFRKKRLHEKKMLSIFASRWLIHVELNGLMACVFFLSVGFLFQSNDSYDCQWNYIKLLQMSALSWDIPIIKEINFRKNNHGLSKLWQQIFKHERITSQFGVVKSHVFCVKDICLTDYDYFFQIWH